MKKFITILCVCACVLGLTACGGTEKKVLDDETATRVESIAQDVVTNLFCAVSAEDAKKLTDQGAEYMAYVVENYLGYKADGNGVIKGFDSWNSAMDEIGGFDSITDMSAKYDEQGSDIVVTLNIQGFNRTAQVEAIFEDDLYNTMNSITCNVDYTFGEKMEKAALNTLMGMGTVFIVLILISLIISLFGFIPKLTELFTKNKNENETKTESVDNAIAQIIEKEEQTDDLELVAVITAAIAAAGTSGSADDFVVRSIRRRNPGKWKKA